MADSNQQINDAKKRIKELDAEIKRLGGEGFKNIDQFVLGLGNNLENATKQVKLMETEVSDLKNAFSNISETLKNIVNDINGSVKTSTLLTRNFNKLEDLANKIQRHREDENILTVKELKEIEKKVQKEKEALDTNYKQAQAELKILDAKIKSGKATKKDTEEHGKLVAYTSEISQALADKISYLNQIVPLTEKERKEEERIQKSLGLTGSILGGITNTFEKIGIQSKFFEDINKDLREAAKEAGSNKWSVLGKGLTSIGKGLGAALADPLVQLTLVYKLFKGLFDLGVSYNKEVAETGKQYGLNAQGAKAMVDYQQMLVAGSHDEYATRKEVAKAMGEINDSMGTTALLSQEIVDGQMSLTEIYGLQGDEAANITKYALLNNTTQEDIVKSVSAQNKGFLNSKKVLQEVAKTEGQLAAFYRNDPKLIGAAVVQAQKLGLTLEKTKGISDALLDIESSLQNEYEAEALIGKDINLNQARYLAMQGDTAGAAAEVLKNIKSSAEFSQMNRLQQDALAKSLGMSADELANSLTSQERLGKLNNQQKKVYDEIKRTRGEEAAQKALAALQDGKSLEHSKMQLDTQKQMEAAIERMKESFAAIVAGPLGGFVEGLASSLSFVSNIFTKIGSVFGLGTGAGSSVGKALGMVVGGAGMIAGVVGLVMMMKNMVGGLVDTLKGKKKHDGSSQSQALYVDVVGDGGGGGGGGYGGGGGRGGRRGRRGRGGRSRGGGGRRRSRGRGKYGAALGFAGGLGMDFLAGEDESGMLDAGIDLSSNVSPGGGGGGGKAPSAPSAPGGTNVAKSAGKGGGFFGKVGSFFKSTGKSLLGGVKSFGSSIWGGLKSAGNWAWGGAKKLGAGALDLAAGPVKGALKTVGKFLGPIMAAVEGVANVASVISDAKARKAAGETVDTSMLGKDIMKGAAYPIANLLLNLIPGVGSALSLADATLGAFGLSPVKWLSDNLIDWLPDDTFKGLGEFAVGEQKAMAAGGIVTGPTNALVGEAGAEAVVPLKEFYAKIDELIAAVRQGGNIYLDGAVVSTKLQSPMAVATRRTG